MHVNLIFASKEGNGPPMMNSFSHEQNLAFYNQRARKGKPSKTGKLFTVNVLEQPNTTKKKGKTNVSLF